MLHRLIKRPNLAAGCKEISELLRVSSEVILQVASNKRSGQDVEAVEPVEATKVDPNSALNTEPILFGVLQLEI